MPLLLQLSFAPIDHFLGVKAVSGRGEAFKAGGRVSWDYEHTTRARSSFTVEVSRNGGWSPVARAGHCATGVQLTLKHIAPTGGPDQVRVVASDGWNAADAPPADGRPFTPTKSRGALARYAGNRTFWADLAHGGSEEDAGNIRWEFGRKTTSGPVVRVPEGFSGEIRLSAPGHLDDIRTIDEDGRVDARGLGEPGCCDD